MRKVLWLFVVLALLFCGWWGVATWSVKSGAYGWLDERRAEGWQADVAAISSGGFPSEVRTVLTDLALTDPTTGLSLALPDFTLAGRTLWPGDVHVTLPAAPITLATPTGRADLSVDEGRADLNLAPGTALELRNLSFTSGPFRTESPAGGLFAGNSAEIRMIQQDGFRGSYDLTLHIGQFTPGAVPRAALLIPADWPLVFTALRAQAQVTFDRPWDRRAVEDRRPQPRRIELQDADVHWGEVRLRLTGTLDVDDSGVPSGPITIKAENWQSMLSLAETSGMLPPELRPTVEGVLSSLAAGSGRTNDLDVTLDLDGGLIRMGFLPIAPAPRFVIR